MAAVRAGVGREAAHEAIKENAVAAALAMREGRAERNDLLDRLAADAASRPDPRQIDALMADLSFTGRRATRSPPSSPDRGDRGSTRRPRPTPRAIL